MSLRERLHRATRRASPAASRTGIRAARLRAWERAADEQLVRLAAPASSAAPAPSRLAAALHARHRRSRCTYGNRPATPPSRPKPLSWNPPNGLPGSKRLNVFAHTTPARRRSAIQRIFDPFSVHTPAERPYGVLFAFSTASAGVRNVSTLSTGPKISSRAMRCDCDTFVNTVGPEPVAAVGERARGLVRLRAFGDAGLVQRLDALQLLGAVDRAEVGVLVERVADAQGRQARAQLVEHDARRPTPARAGAIPRSTRGPWLKKIPLTMPSTAWSSAASSKTTFAALPPSSSVTFLPVPATCVLDRLADRGGTGERDLVDVGVRDERGTRRAAAGDDVDDAGRQRRRPRRPARAAAR